MKRTLTMLLLAASTALALASVTLVPSPPENRGWQAIRGTSNVGTPHATEAACWTAVRADAEQRKATANYRCVNTTAARAEWTADPVTPPPPPPPSDPHNGGVQMGDMPRYNVASIPAPAVGSGTLDLRFTGEQPYRDGDGVGAFRSVCTPSHYNRDDSLIFPGQPGRAHLHAYFGNTLSDANSTPEDIRTKGNSTCRGGIANRSTYWVPAIIDTASGNIVKMDYADVYYKTGYLGVRNQDVKPLPEGLRMIAGDASASREQTWGPASFQCGDGTKQFSMPANCRLPKVTVEMNFPQCWDGRNLDSPDHKSHMAYARNGCPASHPVALPAITYVLHFPIPTGSNTSNWRLASDNYRNAPGGYSMHGDWINGWLKGLPETWTELVINRGLSGGSHILGDGRVMY